MKFKYLFDKWTMYIFLSILPGKWPFINVQNVFMFIVVQIHQTLLIQNKVMFLFFSCCFSSLKNIPVLFIWTRNHCHCWAAIVDLWSAPMTSVFHVNYIQLVPNIQQWHFQFLFRCIFSLPLGIYTMTFNMQDHRSHDLYRCFD